MSIYQRTTNLFRQYACYVYLLYGVDPLTKIFKKHYGATFPDLRTIVAESPFVFVNVDEFLDFPRPIFSNIIYIGGLGMEEGKNTKIKEIEVFIWELSNTSTFILFRRIHFVKPLGPYHKSMVILDLEMIFDSSKP
uniref:glucuronosyltransferase n=1 Tax=Meloidogyne enterolobii TaxID=390850 RepID=A0A6V7V311_MELEN|nr:unnamed protein product [Meloidogyne enterolobii]